MFAAELGKRETFDSPAPQQQPTRGRSLLVFRFLQGHAGEWIHESPGHRPCDNYLCSPSQPQTAVWSVSQHELFPLD